MSSCEPIWLNLRVPGLMTPGPSDGSTGNTEAALPLRCTFFTVEGDCRAPVGPGEQVSAPLSVEYKTMVFVGDTQLVQLVEQLTDVMPSCSTIPSG